MGKSAMKLFSGLWRYVRIFRAFFVAGVQADMEYRINILLRFVVDAIWYVVQVIMFEVLFLHVDHVGVLSHAEMRVFLGVLFAVDSLYMIFFGENLEKFSENVRKGDMDFLLVKPINCQFMVSLQKFSFANLLNLFLALGWLCWAISRLENVVWWQVAELLFLLPCGALIFYGMRFMFGSLAVVYTQSDSFTHVWYQFYKLGMRPDSIYNVWVRMVLMTLLPVSLIASVPSRVILEPSQPWLAFLVIVMTALVIWFSHRTWNFLLRFYTSASS